MDLDEVHVGTDDHVDGELTLRLAGTQHVTVDDGHRAHDAAVRGHPEVGTGHQQRERDVGPARVGISHESGVAADIGDDGARWLFFDELVAERTGGGRASRRQRHGEQEQMGN